MLDDIKVTEKVGSRCKKSPASNPLEPELMFHMTGGPAECQQI